MSLPSYRPRPWRVPQVIPVRDARFSVTVEVRRRYVIATLYEHAQDWRDHWVVAKTILPKVSSARRQRRLIREWGEGVLMTDLERLARALG